MTIVVHTVILLHYQSEALLMLPDELAKISHVISGIKRIAYCVVTAQFSYTVDQLLYYC